MSCVIYPGTFDPITNGHLDVIERAGRLFDEVIIAVAEREGKGPLFSLHERCSMVREAMNERGLKGKVESFSGLLVSFVAAHNAKAIIRGLRAVSDFEFEFQLALMNRKLADQIETVFIMPRETYVYLSSSIVKEVAKLHGDVSPFVAECVRRRLSDKYAK
jgi:pantetheine-phosphate adenylyltransferase